MARDFDPSNQPRTCLWCGRKLYSQSTERRLKLDLKNYATLYRMGGKVEQMRAARLEQHERLKHCYGAHDGFCTSSCAIAFAVKAARRGYRFEPRREASA